MLDIDPPTRLAGRRFLRYANAITQAEIRRMSSSQQTAHQDPDGALGTVRQELRRLTGSTSRTTARRGRQR